MSNETVEIDEALLAFIHERAEEDYLACVESEMLESNPEFMEQFEEALQETKDLLEDNDA